MTTSTSNNTTFRQRVQNNELTKMDRLKVATAASTACVVVTGGLPGPVGALLPSNNAAGAGTALGQPGGSSFTAGTEAARTTAAASPTDTSIAGAQTGVRVIAQPKQACIFLFICTGNNVMGARAPGMRPLGGTKGSNRHSSSKGSEKNVGGKHGKGKSEEHSRKAKGRGGRGARGYNPGAVICDSKGRCFSAWA